VGRVACLSLFLHSFPSSFLPSSLSPFLKVDLAVHLPSAKCHTGMNFTKYKALSTEFVRSITFISQSYGFEKCTDDSFAPAPFIQMSKTPLYKKPFTSCS